MRRRIGFAVYKVQIKGRHGRTGWWKLALHGKQDGYSSLVEYMTIRDQKLVRLGEPDPTTGKYVDTRAIKLVRKSLDEPHRMIEGQFLRGEAGMIQAIHDFDQPENPPSYITKEQEGLLGPLFFRLYLHDGRSYGIAILQTYRSESLKAYLQDDLRRYFAGRHQPLTVKLTPLVDSAVLDKFAAEGKLQDIILVNRGKSVDCRTRMEKTTIGADTLGTDGDKLALQIHRKHGFKSDTLARLRATVKKKAPLSDVISANGMEAADDVLVEIEHNEKTSRFSLINPNETPVVYDKTDQITLGADGHPSWEALRACADEVWNDVQSFL